MAQLSPGKTNASHHAVLAGFLGWTLDAFDFFVVVFLFDTLARQFGVTKREIVWTTTATLAMRPLGALLFGLLADRYGRRIPLMANVIYFSIIELACGFAPNFEWNFAEWLFDRLFTGGGYRAIFVAALGMAADVLDRRVACASGVVYKNQSSGVP